MGDATVTAEPAQVFLFKTNIMNKYHYFKFNPIAWLTGKIQRCSQATKGQFIGLCSHYWIKKCVMSVRDASLRCPNLQELIDAEVITTDSESINIKFLDEQLKDLESAAEKRKQAGRKRQENAKQMLDQFSQN
jgi:hypothetical protein